MSVAAKLGALDERRRFWQTGSEQRRAVEREAGAALPQIVAVVEAAERVAGIRSGAWLELANALAALDEALS